jgi:uncharacterized protein YdaU (DUF1376 family)
MRGRMPGKSPAFQFYPKDFLCDEHVRLMSLAERGVYITLLCVCWLEGSLPNDLKKLAVISGCHGSLLSRIWNVNLKFTFYLDEATGRLRHKRLDLERQKQESFSQIKARAGKAGAEARWNGTAIVLPMANDSSSSSSPISILRKRNNKPLPTTDVPSNSSIHKYSSKEMQDAKFIYHRWGWCRHQPQCKTEEGCLERIIQNKRGA